MKVTRGYWRANVEEQTVPPYRTKVTGHSYIEEEVEVYASDFGGYYYIKNGMYIFAHVVDTSLEVCKRLIENDRKKGYPIQKFNENLEIVN